MPESGATSGASSGEEPLSTMPSPVARDHQQTWGLGATPSYDRVRPPGAPESPQLSTPLADAVRRASRPPADDGMSSSNSATTETRTRVSLGELLTSSGSTRSSLFEPAHAVQPTHISQVGFNLNRDELDAKAVEDDGEDGFFSSKGALWPAYVVPLDTFLELDGLDAHEVSKEAGVVREWLGPGSGESMLFCSHQWLGFSRPDSEDYLQLRSLQGALAAMKRGDVEEVFETPQDAMRCLEAADVKEISGELSWRNAGFVGMVRKRLVDALASAAVWIDYASIAQANDENLQRGVESLPYYIENSTLFLAVVPPSLHADLRVCCDRRSYSDRGWCRFEMLIAELTGTRVKLLVHSSTSVTVMERGEYFIDEAQCERSVFNGEFSCCRRTSGHTRGPHMRCDRERIAGVLEPFFAERIAELHAKGKPHLARLWTCLEGRVFAGNPSEGHSGAARLAHRRPRRRVVSAPRYGNDGEFDALGGCPTYYWTAEGRLDRVATALDGGVDPDLASAPGITLLLEAALAGDAKMVGLLLIKGADPNAATHKLGITALHRAAQAGHVRVLRPLVDGGADPNQARRLDGHTPLHRAAGYGRRRAAAELIKLGARVDAEDARGRTPIDHALAAAHAPTVAKLLALGAGPDGWRSSHSARISSRDAKRPERVTAAVATEAHLRWFYFAQDRWHASHFRSAQERARVLEAFRAFLGVGFECVRRRPGAAHSGLGGGVERLSASDLADEIERAEHCDWTTQLGNIDVDIEPDADGAYVASARFKQRTEPPPDSPEPPATWSMKVKLRVWDAAPFLGAPSKMTAQLLHVRQIKTSDGASSPLVDAARSRPVFTTSRRRLKLHWPSFLRRKKSLPEVAAADTRFRPQNEEPETPRSPFGRIGLARSRSLRSMTTSEPSPTSPGGGAFGRLRRLRRASSLRDTNTI